MAYLKVNLILRLLAEGAENEDGNILIKKYCGITYYVCVYIRLSYFSGMQSACAVLYCHLWPVRLYVFHIIS